jgi:hypothetical protein
MVEKMDKKTNDGGQNTRKLMIEQHEPTYNKGLTEVLRKGSSLVTPIVLLLLKIQW